jgi:hypothetical protein
MSADASTSDTFKRLTVGNWSSPDPVGAAFADTNLATGAQRPMTGDRWAEMMLAVELDVGVPLEVRDLWQVARGVLVYGWFFYPLYALGDEQLHRVADAAILCRYAQLGGPVIARSGRPPNFARRLRWLLDQGHISKHLERRWQAIRELRNLGSHAECQWLQMPMGSVSTLRILAVEINALFATDTQRTPPSTA